MKVRLITPVGTRAMLRVYWGDKDCPNCVGTGRQGIHNAEVPLGLDSDKPFDWELGGRPEDHPDAAWPTKCEHCGAPVPEDANRQIQHRTVYDSGLDHIVPGDMWWVNYLVHDDGKGGIKSYCWDNETDPRGHLHVMLPNGRTWDIDSRASNCTMPHDRTHRCWVRHGEPPNIHVDKNGHTCAAGGGSILAGDYHGYLHNGELVKC